MPVITLSQLRNQYEEKSLTPTILIETLWSKLESADPAIWIHRISKKSLLERAAVLEGQSPSELPLYGITSPPTMLPAASTLVNSPRSVGLGPS